MENATIRRANQATAIWIALLGVLAILVGLGARTTGAVADGALKPNIVLITTDDQVLSTANATFMPRTFTRFGGGGTNFTDFVASTPLCCPARAAMLTGQYAHNNGVNANDYRLLQNKRNILPNWLRSSGYTTAHVGKFLNDYEDFVGNDLQVAPGWDRWFTQIAPRRYYRYAVSRNGNRVSYGDEDGDHLTLVTSRKASKVAAALAAKPDPFYLQVDYYAPHGAAGRDNQCPIPAPQPAPRDEGKFSEEPLYQESLGLDPANASFNEIDIADKPEFLRESVRPDPGLDAEQIAKIRQHWRCTLGALQSVDRGIDVLFATIKDAGELGRTVFIFTSDNGYYFGEHRIPNGKPHAYEENIHMPFMIKIPSQLLGGATPVTEVTKPAVNIDIAPTILDLAGAEPCRRPDQCRVLDGRSLVDLVGGDDSDWPLERAVLLERGDCIYSGVRVDGQVYLGYGFKRRGVCVSSEQVEHYDIDTDPFQLDNLFPAPRGSATGLLEEELARRTQRLAVCSGVAGRDPMPDSGEFCE